MSSMNFLGSSISAAGQLVAAEASAQMEEANAEVAERDAAYARLAGQVEAEYIIEEGRAARGSARAIAAAQGASTTEGSPMIALMDMAAKERRAVLRTQYSHEVEATKYLTEAAFYKQRAFNIRLTGAISALGTALGGSGVQYGDSGSRASGGRNTFNRGSSESAYQNQRAGERADYSDVSGWGDYL